MARQPEKRSGAVAGFVRFRRPVVQVAIKIVLQKRKFLLDVEIDSLQWSVPSILGPHVPRLQCADDMTTMAAADAFDYAAADFLMGKPTGPRAFNDKPQLNLMIAAGGRYRNGTENFIQI